MDTTQESSRFGVVCSCIKSTIGVSGVDDATLDLVQMGLIGNRQ